MNRLVRSAPNANSQTADAHDPTSIGRFSGIAEKDRLIAQQRHEIVRAVLDAGDDGSAERVWPQIIHEVCLERGYPHPPSWRTVKLWVKAFQEGDEDIRSLLPNRGRNRD